MEKNTPAIKFQIGGTAENALSESTVRLNQDCMRKICTYSYSLSFSDTQRITVTMNMATSAALSFSDGISVTLGTYDSNFINDAEITLGGVGPNALHTTAIDYFYKQVDRLLASGWQRFINDDEARLPGSEAEKFNDPNTVLGDPVTTGPWSDPSLRLTQQQWLKLPMLSGWSFYKDHLYLRLDVQRENSDDTPEKSGSYLFTLTIQSEEDFYKDRFRGEQREAWKTLLPSVLQQSALRRSRIEARLKEMGISIDERYQDPVIDAL